MQLCVECGSEKLDSLAPEYPTLLECAICGHPNDLHIDKSKLRKIWTRIARPFVMGGDTWPPAFTLIEPLEIRTINGIEFYSFQTPKGSLPVCEGITGGIVANSFEELEENIWGFSETVLRQQIEREKKAAAKAEEMSNEQFFRYYKF